MKKRLLSFFLAICSILGGVNLQAQDKTIEITPTQLPANGYSTISTYDDATTGLSFAITAYNSSGWQFNKKSSSRACYFAVTKNTKNYIIKGISITLSNTKSAGFKLYKSDTAFSGTTYTNLYNSVGKGTEVESLTGTSTLTSTKTINSQFIGLTHDESAGAFNFNKIVITYGEAKDPSKTDVTLQWGDGGTPVTELNVEAGETFTAPTLKATPEEALSAVIYSSSNEDVATITNGTLELKGFGTAEITAEIKGNDTYNDASAKYTLTYSKRDPQLYFASDVRYGKLGVGVVWEAAKHLSDGTLTYTSSNPDIVAINATTGQILPEDVKAAGTVVITATLEATSTYNEATAEYRIIIQDANAPQNGRETFDFTTENPYGMTTYNQDLDPSGSKYEENITSITSGDVVMSFYGDYRSYKYNSSSAQGDYLTFRKVFSGTTSSFTITVPEGGIIEKITINTVDTFTPSSSTINNGTGEEDQLKVWLPGENEYNSVTFSNTTSATIKLKSVTVVWKSKNSDLSIANLSFDQTVYNTTVGVETEVNTVNNPNNVATAYTIDCLNEDEYTLTEADGKLAITVNKVGVYTLRAKSEATDQYLPGIAILRLNVFPVVDINVNDNSATIGDNGIDVSNGDKVSFGELPTTVQLFYLQETAEETTPAARAAAQITHDDIDVEYAGEPIEFTKPGYLHYYMSYAGAYNSPIYTIPVSVDGKTPTGIENVAADNANAPVEYFNLQGMRVDNPAGGLYIRRQGNIATKVIVK